MSPSEPKDILMYCHKDVVMRPDNSVAYKAGKFYLFRWVKNGWFVTDESGDTNHTWGNAGRDGLETDTTVAKYFRREGPDYPPKEVNLFRIGV